MSSKDNAIEIHSDSDDSSTKTGVQVDVNPEDYVQPDIPSRVLGIGDDEFACLTYEAKDIEIMKHPYFWIDQPHMASFIKVICINLHMFILLSYHSYLTLHTNVRNFQHLSRSIHAT